MGENLTDPAAPPPSDVASAVAAAVAPSNSLFLRKIQFHPERKPYSPISISDSSSFRLETLNPSSSEPQRPPAAVGVAGPVPSLSGKRSDGGFDPELSFRITFRRIGAGLRNLGNTCFLNSVLQCLTYTEPFAAYLQSGKHKSSCRTAGFCAMCALQNHVMNALQSTGQIVSPLHLVKNLRCISRNFRTSRQEDAHEYMVNLLESMHKCCLPSGVPTESPSAYEKSLVHKIFGGYLRSQVRCTQCQYCSNKIEPFLDLSLKIVKSDSLRKALAHFTAAEQLDGGERQYQCQRCKEKVKASKQLTVHKAPHVLTIHLKRFSSHIPGEKINKKVFFEPTLDMKPFVSDPHEANLKYTLYGVLVHAGWSTHSGHYYCFVRTSTGIWHSLDDNQVRQVSEKAVLAQRAYMLFYVRDRSSTIKCSVDVAREDHFFLNVSGARVTPKATSVLNGEIQNNQMVTEPSIPAQPINSRLDPGATSMVSEINYIPCKMMNGVSRSLEELGTVSSQLNHINATGKEHFNRTTELQNTDPKIDKHTSGLQYQNGGEGDLELKKSGLDTSLMMSSSEQDAVAVIERKKLLSKCSHTNLKRKKLSKSLLKVQHFGRKQLFLTSFLLHRKKKSKRQISNRKKVVKNKIREAISTYDQVASTSETIMANAPFAHSSKKRSRSDSHKQNIKKERVDVKCDIGDFVHNRNLDKNNKSKVMVGNSEQLRISFDSTENRGDEREPDAFSQDPVQNGAMSLLMGLKETMVPRWDDIEMEASESHNSSNARNNIGYVLDEWNEELDRGKRKKLKKPRRSSTGPNPFQEIANMNIEQTMKRTHIGSGIQPLRI